MSLDIDMYHVDSPLFSSRSFRLIARLNDPGSGLLGSRSFQFSLLFFMSFLAWGVQTCSGCLGDPPAYSQGNHFYAFMNDSETQQLTALEHMGTKWKPGCSGLLRYSDSWLGIFLHRPLVLFFLGNSHAHAHSKKGGTSDDAVLF